MSVNLHKSSTPIQSPTQPSTPSQPPTSPVEALRSRLDFSIFDSYCDSNIRSELLHHGVNDLGLDSAKATIVVDMELETRGWANEAKLCEELDGLLHRFTDRDKKLDAKERTDAVQIVCRPKAGFAKGLDFETAEHRIVEFCRAHGVKVKVGFLKWAVP